MRFFIVILTLLMALEAFASSRTESVLSSDLQAQFAELAKRQEDIALAKSSMQNLQAKLKDARRGKDTFLKIRKVAGTLAIVGIAIGAYKLTFPSGVSLTGLKLMVSSYVAVAGLNEGMIKLNQTDIETLSREIILALIKISKAEASLNKRIALLCKEDPRDRLCY